MRTVHDLSLTYDERIAGYSDSTARTREADGWNARWLRIYSHAGTHMDAPKHFLRDLSGIDEYPVARFTSIAHLVRLTIEEAGQEIKVADLGAVADVFEAGESLLFQTGWSHRLGTPAYRDDLPRITPELARWCVDRGVNVLGVEPPSVADVNNLPEVTEVHEILLRGDIIIVEGLCKLEHITADRVTLIALPLKIAGGDGAPARVIAIEESPAP